MEPILLALQAAFLILLYLFIWRVVRSASRDLRVASASQESFIMAPAQVRAATGQPPVPDEAPRLEVVASPSLEVGSSLDVGPVAVTVGRSEDNALSLGKDDYASSHHARIEAARDGVWIVDLDSTNGTFVNGERLDGRRRLHRGDAIRIGQTELRFAR